MYSSPKMSGLLCEHCKASFIILIINPALLHPIFQLYTIGLITILRENKQQKCSTKYKNTILDILCS